MTIVDALHNYAAALRVSGTDEAADRAWADFWESLDPDVRAIADKGDFEWLDALARHCFEAGWHQALRRSAELAARALEQAA